MIFSSRRNLVRTVEWNGCTAVRKLFASPDDWQHELEVWQSLCGRVAVPEIYISVPGALLMEYLPGSTLLDELDRQEREGFCAAPWLALRKWLKDVHTITGLCPSDGNLRNFLWNGRNLFGIDFEGYAHLPFADVLAKIAAFILEYSPRNTMIKQQAAGVLFEGDTSRAQQLLLERRQKKHVLQTDAAFILLAGGKSSRMGCDKASLPFLGSTLMEFQLDKARLLGCRDILVSGEHPEVEGIRSIADIYPERGPLGGLHACLRAADHTSCIVLGVDMPFLPVCELRALLREHQASGAEITIAVHEDRWEPLAGVYDSGLAERIEPMIELSGAPVRALLQRSACRFRRTELRELFWMNCNTPDEWETVFAGHKG